MYKILSIAAISAKPRMALDQFLAAQSFAAKAKAALAVPISSKTALDAFNNTLARIGYGTSNLLEGTNYPLTRMTWQYLTLMSLYRSNWIARKLIDAVAEDMTKNQISFVTEKSPATIKKLETAMKFTATWARFLDALKWARLFGGAGAVIILKGQKLDQPLDLDDVPLDSYRGLLVFDRWSGIAPSAKISTDLERPHDFGLPESYRITTENAGGYDVHASRVLRFTGRSLPQWEFQAEQRWGISEIEVIYEELKKRDNTSWNLASLVFRANIFELRQKNLAQMLSGLGANPAAQNNFYTTLQAQTQLMSNQGIVVSDPEGGGLSTHQYGFAGIADVYVQFMLDICGACEIPFSRLFGRGASGLGQTGEGDEHVYYEMIGQKQKRELDPQLMKLVPVIAASTLGKVPSDLEWTWNPVRSLTDKEQVELAAANTTAVVEAYNAGLTSQRTSLLELKQQSSVTNVFSNLTDEDIENADDEAQSMGEEMDLGLPDVVGGKEGAATDADLDRDKFKGHVWFQGVCEYCKEKSTKNNFYKPCAARPRSQEEYERFSRLRKPIKDAAAEHIQEEIVFAGLSIAVENPVGSVRWGDNWEVTMRNAYGYVNGSEGVDGDEVDVFLGPDENAPNVYVVHTKGGDPEDKAMLGFGSAAEAKAAFEVNYSNKGEFFDSMDKVPLEEFRRKIFSSHHARRVA